MKITLRSPGKLHRTKQAIVPIVISVVTLLGLGPQTSTVSQAAGGLVGLHVVGNQIENSGGQTVILRGVDRSGSEYACTGSASASDGPSDLASVQAIASWHTNAVRIPLNEGCWLGIGGMAESAGAYQQAIQAYVTLLGQNGLVAILDLHWSAPGSYRAGGQEPMADQDHSPTFWTSVATTFKGNSSVIFDLYNEPDPLPYSSSYPGGFSAWQNASFACVRNGCTATASQGGSYQTAGMQELVNTVRATGASNIVMIGGIQMSETISQYLGSGNTPGSYLPSDSLGNMAVSTHMYAADACGDVSCWNGTVAPVAARYPIIVGEFGDTDCSSTLTNTLLPWLDAHGISYLGWTWDTWSNSCQGLVTSYNGTASQPYGQAYKDHLASVAGSATPSATSVPATATPSATSVPATATPSATRVPATATPSATSVPTTATRTATRVPATATETTIVLLPSSTAVVTTGPIDIIGMPTFLPEPPPVPTVGSSRPTPAPKPSVCSNMQVTHVIFPAVIEPSQFVTVYAKTAPGACVRMSITVVHRHHSFTRKAALFYVTSSATADSRGNVRIRASAGRGRFGNAEALVMVYGKRAGHRYTIQKLIPVKPKI